MSDISSDQESSTINNESSTSSKESSTIGVETSTIIVLRHGEPSGGTGLSSSERIFRGITDDALTKRGWLQMSTALKDVKDIHLILTSPLIRCSEFAHKLSKERSLPLQTIDALKEINFGLWDGQSVKKIAENDAEQLKKFWQDPMENTPPGGEPVLDFKKRIVSFWNELLTTQRGKNCLLVSHGGVQKMILAEVLKMPAEAIHNIEVPYACCSIFQVYYNGTEYLTTLKSHTHLKDGH